MSEYRDAQLKRIADALERIADAQEGRRTPGYEKAVAALKEMPDDIPPEPVKAAPVTKEEVVAALNSYGRVNGVAAAKKVLASFASSGMLADVPEAKWPDLVGILKGGA